MLSAICLAGLSAAVAAAAAVPELTLPWEKYVLASNGLQVILSEDHTTPLVAISVWYGAGPANEPPARSGFAHLFEHLMFQGSAHVGDDEHFRLLEAAGASMVNGATDFDYTTYLETLPANEFALGLWLESDRMGFLLAGLDQTKLDNQRQVVMNERRQTLENTPYGQSDERMVQMLFPPGHPYHGYIIGSPADLKAATLADVQSFYDQHYAPGNASLVIAGDFVPEEAKQLVDRYFGSLPPRPVPLRRVVPKPVLNGPQRVWVEEAVRLPRLQLGWLTPSAFAPGDADCDVLAALLGQGLASRLHRLLVYELELAESVNATQSSMALTSMFTITVLGRPGADLSRVEAELEAALDRLRQEPPNDHEIARVRNQILTDTVRCLQDLGGFSGRAEILNRYNHYLGEPGQLHADLARYAAVTPASLQQAAAAFLNREQRIAVLTVPKE